MIVELSEPEASLVMAALRGWQDMAEPLHLVDEYEAYFEQHEPLSPHEIDLVCARIAAAAMAARKK